MGKPKCSVHGCNSKYQAKEGIISFFGLPNEKERRAEWLQAIGLPEELAQSSTKVCSLHFLESELATVGCRKYVVGTVTPHINLRPARKKNMVVSYPACSGEPIEHVEMVASDPTLGPSLKAGEENCSACMVIKSENESLETISNAVLSMPSSPESSSSLIIPLQTQNISTYSQPQHNNTSRLESRYSARKQHAPRPLQGLNKRKKEEKFKILQKLEDIITRNTDDDQIFGDYVATSLRDLTDLNKKKLKILIQKNIIEFQELEINQGNLSTQATFPSFETIRIPSSLRIVEIRPS